MALMNLERRLCDALEEHLATGKPARVPEGSTILWNAFTALARARTYSSLGPNPIGYSEIEAYARLMRMPLEPRHVRIIAAMDRVWMAAASRRDQPPGTPSADLSPGLFDAVVG